MRCCCVWLVCRMPTLESYGGKVLWMSGSDVISLLDVSGCSVAEMHTSSTDARSLLTAFTVNYSTKHTYPGAEQRVVVSYGRG